MSKKEEETDNQVTIVVPVPETRKEVERGACSRFDWNDIRDASSLIEHASIICQREKAKQTKGKHIRKSMRILNEVERKRGQDRWGKTE